MAATTTSYWQLCLILAFIVLFSIYVAVMFKVNKRSEYNHFVQMVSPERRN